ncbi:MAG: hypothetical protein A2079_03600 [Geobacteraceae bacterium GWC2_48_7]|nr:MAG: hypothetical protein A2079_03600 [Geobacteraceae bacterium GWC2_48_7]
MKKIIMVMLSLCMLFATSPLMAADGTAERRDGSTLSQQDQCLLYSKKCMDQADTLQDKMRKLDAEIKKGTRKYTPEELKRLEDKLKDANNTLDLLLRH